MKWPVTIIIKPPVPTERQGVTIALFGLATLMLVMAFHDAALWDIDTFKTVLQAVVVSGLLNMVGAFHFSANKSDDVKAENTGKAFDAITATANAGTEQATGKPEDPVHTVEETK